MRINLLPVEHRPLPMFDSKRVFIITSCCILVCLSLFGALFYFFQWKSANDNLINITQQLDSLQGKREQISDNEQRMADMKRRQEEVENIKKFYPRFDSELKHVADSLIEDVWLREVNFSQPE